MVPLDSHLPFSNEGNLIIKWTRMPMGSMPMGSHRNK